MTTHDGPLFGDFSKYIINPSGATFEDFLRENNNYLYFGNLSVDSVQYRSGKFYGLALNPMNNKEIKHNACEKLPLEDNSVEGLQSEDCFEHIDYEKVLDIINEAYRVLKPGKTFRLSLPDYNCPLLKHRSVYDCYGNWLCDLAVGGSVSADYNSSVKVEFKAGGDSHLWASTYDNVCSLVEKSKFNKINWLQCYFDKELWHCENFDQSIMPVKRTPPTDMRNNGKPVSIVVDLVK
jgi:predicted SAM-dependent methyltransferase